MIFPHGLAVSLPARELLKTPLPGNFVDADTVLELDISLRLRAAVHALKAAYEDRGAALTFIARPEIFPEGMADATMRERLGGCRDHLYLCDGTTVQLIPGLKNHLFFYEHGDPAALAAFARFVSWVPELPAQLSSQFNTAFTFWDGQTAITPLPLLLQMDTAPASGLPKALHYVFSAPGGVYTPALAASLRVPPNAPATFARGTYIPFSAAAAADPEFCRLTAQHLLRHLGRKDYLTLLGTPLPKAPGANPLEAIGTVLAGLQNAGVALPAAVLRNAMFVATPPDVHTLCRPGAAFELLMPDSFEYWLLPRSFYAGFSKITLVRPSRRKADKYKLTELLSIAFGAKPAVQWTSPVRTLSMDYLPAND
jgi:hypothetical protein